MPSEAHPSGSVTLIVGDDDTAIAQRSGDVAVLATPRVIALAEEASCLAVGPQLREGETTVGTRVEIAHLQAVPVGQEVTAEAVLERTDGRRLVFTVSVSSDHGLVAAGKITRAVVNRAEFLEKAG